MQKTGPDHPLRLCMKIFKAKSLCLSNRTYSGEKKEKEKGKAAECRKLNLFNNSILTELQHAILNTGKALSKNISSFT